MNSGNITDEIIAAYPDHHRENPNSDRNFILEQLQRTCSAGVFNAVHRIPPMTSSQRLFNTMDF